MKAKAHVDVVALLDLQLRGRLRLVDAHSAEPEYGRPDGGQLPVADGAHELSQRHGRRDHVARRAADVRHVVLRHGNAWGHASAVPLEKDEISM